MRIVGFSEGSRGDSPGLVGIPMMLKSVAERGHEVVLLMGGAVPPARVEFACPNVISALERKQGLGSFGIVCTRSWSRWTFSPAMILRYRKLVRGADFVTLHSLYSFPVLLGYALARLYRKPYGIWPHGVLAPFQRKVSAQRKRVYNKLFADRILSNAAVIVYSAEGEREEAVPLGFQSPSVVIADGFEAEEFYTLPPHGAFRERFLHGYQGPLVLFLSRLSAKKGIDLLFQAMRLVVAKMPDVRLAVVGPPDPAVFQKQVLQWMSDNRMESRTVLTGAANPKVRLEAFADADIFVLPSHEENFGNVVFEAMASKLPVVVSDTLNYSHEFERSGGAAVVPRTPEAFADAILQMLSHPELCAEMAERGRVFSSKYSLKETGSKIERMIESISKKEPIPEDMLPQFPGKMAQQVRHGS